MITQRNLIQVLLDNDFVSTRADCNTFVHAEDDGDVRNQLSVSVLCTHFCVTMRIYKITDDVIHENRQDYYFTYTHNTLPALCDAIALHANLRLDF